MNRFSLLRPLFGLALLAGSALSIQPAQAAVTGELRVGVVLVNFQDNATQPITTAAASQTVFGSVSDFLWESSYGQFLLSGDTYGWYTLPLSASQCDTTRIAQEADRAAGAAGVNLQAYQTLIYMFPANTGCGFSGVGGTNAAGQKLVFIHDKAGMSTKVIAHELGHSFGLMHSDGLDCDGGPMSGTCVQLSYADPADVMGTRLAHFNAFQKELLGWLGTPTSPAIQTVAASGRYRVEPMAAAGTGTRALRIARGADAQGRMRYYYLEFRQAVGFDAGLASVGSLVQGVLVHTGTQGDALSSRVLDMTPGSASSSRTADFEDGVLAVGGSFRDAAAGLAFQVASADASGALIDVTIDAAQPPPPPPAGELSVTGGSNKTSYVRGETVALSAQARVDGAVASGVAVAFTVVAPGGVTTRYSATSGSDGWARASFKTGKAKSAIGRYSLGIGASQGSGSASASSVFDVR